MAIVNLLKLERIEPITTADVTEVTDLNYVTDADLINLGNLSGTNTGDQDLSGLIPKTDISTDDTLGGETPSDTLVTSESAVKGYVDTIIGDLPVPYTPNGSIDCSLNPNYPASTVGQCYLVSVAGKIGGASGTVVEALDVIVCNVTNAGGTEAAVGADFSVVQGNIINGVSSSTAVSVDGDLVVYDSTTGKIIKSSGINIADIITSARAKRELHAVGSLSAGQTVVSLAEIPLADTEVVVLDGQELYPTEYTITTDDSTGTIITFGFGLRVDNSLVIRYTY